ncbi:hypothetical protein [Puerhibacterium sp. TATVAM-FAB25]|uniref:hypothetical protein n=1 Tax=Puerhibacterium sp. TATVAM-FAB25 TaxID=3093699 RepID=UPI00397CE7E9
MLSVLWWALAGAAAPSLLSYVPFAILAVAAEPRYLPEALQWAPLMVIMFLRPRRGHSSVSMESRHAKRPGTAEFCGSGPLASRYGYRV